MNQFIKIINVIIKPWVFLSYLALIIACYLWFDIPVAEYFYTMHLNTHFPGLVLITALGKAMIYVLLFGLAGLFFRYVIQNKKQEARAWFLLLCLLIPNAICLVIKFVLGRARPELWFNSHEYGFYWIKFDKLYWSFPSSHTTAVMGLLIGFSLLFPRYLILFIIPALLIIASRIMLYQHYLSDVLTAIYLTLIEIGILVYCIKERNWFLKTT